MQFYTTELLELPPTQPIKFLKCVVTPILSSVWAEHTQCRTVVTQCPVCFSHKHELSMVRHKAERKQATSSKLSLIDVRLLLRET
jgi:hypothetical protein